MNTSEFAGQVKPIEIDLIRPSSRNPRGTILRNDSFYRLTDSIAQVGVLVPIVVMELEDKSSGKQYELVDGERRYWAAKELGQPSLPAHVLHQHTWTRDLRSLMFHLHMTREQWDPLAQCRSLAEAYPELREGLKFEDKEAWTKRLARDTGMPPVTARDRVHVLAWPPNLKEKIYAFNDLKRTRDVEGIYSYVLAIEASIIEPSRKAFSDYYNHHRPPEVKANEVRGFLFEKVTVGLETGTMTSREQIRGVSPLFSLQLTAQNKRIAQKLFKDLVTKSETQFDDIKAEMKACLPQVSSEAAPNPKRLVTLVRSLQQAITAYDISYIENTTSRETTRSKLRSELISALDDLETSITQLKARLND